MPHQKHVNFQEQASPRSVLKQLFSAFWRNKIRVCSLTDPHGPTHFKQAETRQCAAARNFHLFSVKLLTKLDARQDIRVVCDMNCMLNAKLEDELYQ